MTVRVVHVPAPGGEYPVLIGAGARTRIPSLLRAAGASRVHVVTDSTVERLHAPRFLQLVSRARVPVSRSVVPAGERSKRAGELERLWRECVRAGCDRGTVLIALGGGVVGDLAGFAAASLLRGVRFFQVPTTLLAMVDASVGGKTGINLPEGKNLVGAFHQPGAVVADLDFLRTLPLREARAGWAEVIKTAAIRDRRLFERLERDREKLLAREPGPLASVIERCVRIKADVVGRDERESGLRMILNFGHTLAHAIESVKRYGGFLHGEAVAVGMAFAAALGETLGTTDRGTSARLRGAIGAYGLPIHVNGVTPARLLEAMARDKKRGPRGPRWVFLREIGEARISETVPPRIVRDQLRSFLLNQGGAS